MSGPFVDAKECAAYWIKRAEAAEAKLSEMSEWQPIETAPKDGPHFLVWCPEIHCTFDVWRNTGKGEQFNLWGCGGRALERDYSVTPTHWMPLPDPPEVSP